MDTSSPITSAKLARISRIPGWAASITSCVLSIQPLHGLLRMNAGLDIDMKHVIDVLRRRRVITLERVRYDTRSEEHTSELQSLMRISYAVFCLNKKIINILMQIHHN